MRNRIDFLDIGPNRIGIVAAEAIFGHLQTAPNEPEVRDYRKRLDSTWLIDELYRVRNIRPSFRWGLWGGLAYSAVDTFLFRGRAPWTLRHRADHLQLGKLSETPPIAYPRPDNVITFDKLTSVHLANAKHEADQPSHIKLRNPRIPIEVNLNVYGSPEQLYCPAGVFEIVGEHHNRRLQINAQNCVHCKTCDIKDPSQNIEWTVPEGGGGPNYPAM